MKNVKKSALNVLALLLLTSCGTQSAGPGGIFGIKAEQAQNNYRFDPQLVEMEKNPLVKEALAFLGSNDLTRASGSINKALKLDPENSRLHLINALIYQGMAEGGDRAKLAEAEVGYRLSLKNDPSNYWANYQLGCLYMFTQNFEMAQQVFANGLLYHDGDNELLLGLASSSYAAEDVHTAYIAASKMNNGQSLSDPRFQYVSALIFAAAGDTRLADKYRSNFYGDQNDSRVSLPGDLDAKLKRWQVIHSESLIKNEYSAQSGEPGASGADEIKSKLDVFHEDMLYIDVIILRSEESTAESKGVNLLKGLQLSFQSTLFSTRNQATITDGTRRESVTKEYFSPEVSIPGVDYVLNIYNNFSTRTEIIGRPTIIAMDGRKSEFHSGSNLHVAFASGVSGGGRLEEIPVGVVISVEPNFSSEDRSVVDLEVEVERTFLESASALVGFDNFAQTSRNGVSANVKAALGETIILGGLSDREIFESGDNVTGLGGVPVLGNLFSEQERATIDKSVVIMLTPRRPVSDKEGYLDYLKNQGLAKLGFLEQLKREASWTTGDENLASVLDGFRRTVRYSRGFRADDLPVDFWMANYDFKIMLTKKDPN